MSAFAEDYISKSNYLRNGMTKRQDPSTSLTLDPSVISSRFSQDGITGAGGSGKYQWSLEMIIHSKFLCSIHTFIDVNEQLYKLLCYAVSCASHQWHTTDDGFVQSCTHGNPPFQSEYGEAAFNVFQTCFSY